MGNNVVEPHVGSASERAPSMFDKVAATVDEQMQKPFARLGFFVGGSPKTTMGLSLFVCVLMMSGLSQIGPMTESRSDKVHSTVAPSFVCSRKSLNQNPTKFSPK